MGLFLLVFGGGLEYVFSFFIIRGIVVMVDDMVVFVFELCFSMGILDVCDLWIG